MDPDNVDVNGVLQYHKHILQFPSIQSMHKRLKVRQHKYTCAHNVTTKVQTKDKSLMHLTTNPSMLCRPGTELEMSPSGALPPSHVPQCLTEMSAAWARQGPSAGPWPPLITVCVFRGEDCDSPVRLHHCAAESGCTISWQSHLHSKLNIVVIWINYRADPHTQLDYWQFGKVSKDISNTD